MVEQAVAAIRAGEPVILPTDTVYGLCAAPTARTPARGLPSEGAAGDARSALLAADVDTLLERVPELRGAGGDRASVLPGPYTLVLPNPARRFRWLNGTRRRRSACACPCSRAPPRRLRRSGAVAATSANLHGGADPRRLEEVPPEIREACAAVMDGGECPGIPRP